MTGIGSKISEIYRLEQLSAENSCIHRLHPLVKIAVTVVYILCIVSFDRYALPALAPFVFYPVMVMTLADIPWGLIGKRAAIALPFCLFAGITNILFDQRVMFWLGSVAISYGWVSFWAIMLRTFLAVAAVLILVAITPFRELTDQLRRLHLPSMLVMLLEMVYRYIGTLLEEAATMVTAYQLRSGHTGAVEMKHMGSFVGQLLLRSFDRAERVYQAMQCRGYGLCSWQQSKRPLQFGDWLFLLLGCGSSVMFRLVDLPVVVGRWFIC